MTDTDTIEAVYLRVGERVRARRMRAGWSQQTLADQAGMSRSVVANLETGRCRLLLHDLLTLAEVLRIKPTALMR